jgi:hypothetical protein
MSDAPVTDWSRGLELKAGDWFIGLYQPSPETNGFWEGVTQRELRLNSFSEVHRAPSAAFAGSTPYVVGLVRLEEGVHLFTRFEGGPVAIDTKVTVDFRVLELGKLMPVFRVADA